MRERVSEGKKKRGRERREGVREGGGVHQVYEGRQQE